MCVYSALICFACAKSKLKRELRVTSAVHLYFWVFAQGHAGINGVEKSSCQLIIIIIIVRVGLFPLNESHNSLFIIYNTDTKQIKS